MATIPEPAETPIAEPDAGWPRFILAAALALAERGGAVFPCNTKKRPCTKHGFKDASRDPDTIRRLWHDYPNAAIGLCTGPASGVWVIDVDDQVAWPAFVADHPPILTRTVRTPRGGTHYYFQWDESRPVGNSTGSLPPGVDVRGQGGYVIAPPSRRDDGVAYEVVDRTVPIAVAPDWLYAAIAARHAGQTDLAGEPIGDNGGAECLEHKRRLHRYAEAALDDECAKLADVAPGGRNSALNTAALNLGRIAKSARLGDTRIRDRLLEAATANSLIDDDGQAAATKTIRSGLSAGRKNPRDLVFEVDLDNEAEPAAAADLNGHHPQQWRRSLSNGPQQPLQEPRPNGPTEWPRHLHMAAGT